MKNLVSFFEIPAVDFKRAVNFYELVFDVKIEISECENEKMGFFPHCEGAISEAENFKPSAEGVLISLKTENIEEALERISKNAGHVLIGKTAIEPLEKGFFAVFIDCEGNKIGLHQQS